MLKFHWDNVQSHEFVDWIKDVANNCLLKGEEVVFSKLHEELAKAPKSQAEACNEALALPNFLTVSPLGDAEISNLDFGSSPPTVEILEIEAVSHEDVRLYFAQANQDERENDEQPENHDANVTLDEGKSATTHAPTYSFADEASDAPSTPRSSINCRSFSDVSETITEIRGPEHAIDEVPSLLDGVTMFQSERSFVGPKDNCNLGGSRFQEDSTEAEDFCIKLRVKYNGTGTGTFSAALQLGLPKFLTPDILAPANKPLASMPFSIHIYGLALCIDISVMVLRSQTAKDIAETFKTRGDVVMDQMGIKASVPSEAAMSFLETPIAQLSKSSINRKVNGDTYTHTHTSSFNNEDRPIPDQGAFKQRTEGVFEPMTIHVTPDETSTETTPLEIKSPQQLQPSATPFISGRFRQRRPISSASGKANTVFSSPEGPLLSARRNKTPSHTEAKETNVPMSNRNLNSLFSVDDKSQKAAANCDDASSSEEATASRAPQPAKASLPLSHASQPQAQRSQMQLPSLFVSMSGGPYIAKNPLHFNDPDYVKSLSHIPALSTPQLRASHLYDLPKGQVVRRVGLCVTLGLPLKDDVKKNAQNTNCFFQDKLQSVEKYLLYKLTKTLDETLLYPFILPVQLDSKP